MNAQILIHLKKPLAIHEHEDELSVSLILGLLAVGIGFSLIEWFIDVVLLAMLIVWRNFIGMHNMSYSPISGRFAAPFLCCFLCKIVKYSSLFLFGSTNIVHCMRDRISLRLQLHLMKRVE